MKLPSFLEQVQAVLQMIGSSFTTIGLLLISILLGLFLFLNVKRKNKIVTVVLSILYLGALILLTCYYHEILFSWIDLWIDKILGSIYFPSLSFYIAILILTHGIILYILLRPTVSTIAKRTSAIYFILIQVLMLFFFVISLQNPVDFTNKYSMYQTKELLTILPFSIKLFLLFLTTLFIIWYVHKVQKLLKGPEKTEQ